MKNYKEEILDKKLVMEFEKTSLVEISEKEAEKKLLDSFNTDIGKEEDSEFKQAVESIVSSVYPYIVEKLGTPEQGVPKVEVWVDIYERLSNIKGMRGEDSKKTKAQYVDEDNMIYVYYPNMNDVEDIIRSLLHEYTHSLQDSDRTEQRKKGYDLDPNEIEAREAELKWKDYLGYVENDLPNRPVEKETTEISRSLRKARKAGVGTKFSKYAVKANPQRFRKYTRDKYLNEQMDLNPPIDRGDIIRVLDVAKDKEMETIQYDGEINVIDLDSYINDLAIPFQEYVIMHKYKSFPRPKDVDLWRVLPVAKTPEGDYETIGGFGSGHGKRLESVPHVLTSLDKWQMVKPYDGPGDVKMPEKDYGKNAGDGFKWGGTYYSWNDDNWDEEESKGKYIPKEMSEQEGETQKDMELSLNQEDGYELFGQTFDRNEVIIMNQLVRKFTKDEIETLATVDFHGIPNDIKNKFRDFIKLFGINSQWSYYDGPDFMRYSAIYPKWALDNWSDAITEDGSLDFSQVTDAHKSYPSVYEVTANEEGWEKVFKSGSIMVPAWDSEDAWERADSNFWEYEPDMEAYDYGDWESDDLELGDVVHQEVLKEQKIDTTNPENMSPDLEIGDRIMVWDLTPDPAPPGGHAVEIPLPRTIIGTVTDSLDDDELDMDEYRGGIKYIVRDDNTGEEYGLYRGHNTSQDFITPMTYEGRDKWVKLPPKNLNESKKILGKGMMSPRAFDTYCKKHNVNESEKKSLKNKLSEAGVIFTKNWWEYYNEKQIKV